MQVFTLQILISRAESNIIMPKRVSGAEGKELRDTHFFIGNSVA